MVSRGGTFLVEWMIHSGKENPLYEKYDEILAIAKEYDVTMSLGTPWAWHKRMHLIVRRFMS